MCQAQRLHVEYYGLTHVTAPQVHQRTVAREKIGRLMKGEASSALRE